jgi:hypothetical protein
MNIEYGNGKTEFGPGVEISLTGDEVALAIRAFLVARNIFIVGPSTTSVNGELIEDGSIYVDPSGKAIADGVEFSGRGV